MAATSQQIRRTQEQRSAATRARLLDATIECLVELGYAGMTTTEVVRRAGVSRGAQVHHFPTKAELVEQAIVHLARRRREELRTELERLRRNGDNVSIAVEMLWKSFAGPLFTAAVELIVAARTDPALRSAVVAVERDAADGIREFCAEVFGPHAMRRAAFRDGIDLTIALTVGMAFRAMMTGERDDTRLLATWKRLVRPLIDEAGARAKPMKGNT